jgi:uncharacterized membrane-anchored protein YhcB (DUF1043 family)
MTETKKRRLHPFFAALIGAAAGAVAVFLTDEKNRNKLKAKADELKSQAIKKRLELEKKLLVAKKQGKKTLVKKLQQTIKNLENK